MNPDLRCIEEWTGHRQPRNPMRTLAVISLLFFVAVLACAVTGCQGLTLTVSPDGTFGGSYTLPPVAPRVIPAK